MGREATGMGGGATGRVTVLAGEFAECLLPADRGLACRDRGRLAQRREGRVRGRTKLSRIERSPVAAVGDLDIQIPHPDERSGERLPVLPSESSIDVDRIARED